LLRGTRYDRNLSNQATAKDRFAYPLHGFIFGIIAMTLSLFTGISLFDNMYFDFLSVGCICMNVQHDHYRKPIGDHKFSPKLYIAQQSLLQLLVLQSTVAGTQATECGCGAVATNWLEVLEAEGSTI
jgi:hypothetical protein